MKDWRVRILSSTRFQRFAADFPLTRAVAKKNAAASFDLCNGFVYSQVLLACVQLDLFNTLDGRTLNLEQISQEIGLPLEGTDRLIKAARALDLVEPRSGERYSIGPAAAALMGNPGVFDMIRHHQRFYEDLSDPVALLRERTGDTHLSRFWTYAGSESPTESASDDSAAYSALMSRTQAFVAHDIVDTFPFKNHGKLLDVAGGDGTFLRTVSQYFPHLDLALMDLPNVADIAKARFAESGITASVTGGDMFQDHWPESADLISLVRVLHDHDDAPIRAILKKARAALAPGGKLLIAEPTADDARSGEAYFGLYLWAMGSGRARSVSELKAFLEDAGFTTIRELKTRQPLLIRAIIAS